MRHGRRLQPLPGLDVLGNGGPDLFGDQPHPLLVHRDQQVFLGGEMVIQRPRQHVHGRRNVAHRGGGIAFLAEQPRRLVQDQGQAVIAARNA